MSNNKKGKSLRKILTTAYTAILIGASGMVVADTLFISKTWQSSVMKRQRQRTQPQERAQAVRERRGTQVALVARALLQHQP